MLVGLSSLRLLIVYILHMFYSTPAIISRNTELRTMTVSLYYWRGGVECGGMPMEEWDMGNRCFASRPECA
jgi:hypothetical protein